MASRQALGLFVLILLAVACRSSEEADPDPTVPPVVFAPTPTIGDNTPTVTSVRPEPTTTADVDRAAIFRVDPLTLETLPEFEPIPMGDWLWGDTSADGQWLATISHNETGFDRRMHLVHLPSWEMRDEWEVFFDDFSPETSDGGSVFLMDSSRMIPRLVRYTVGEELPETVADLPLMSLWESHLFGDEIFAVFGVRTEAGRDTGQATIAVVDLITGTVTSIPLPDVPVGVVREVELTSSLSGVVDVSPALVWDDDRRGALIVHSGEDIVTEVALDSGEVISHNFGPEIREFTDWSPSWQHTGELWFASHRRTAALSPDGRQLFVGTMTGDFEVDGESWSVVTTSTGIVNVGTSTWDIVGRLDAPISDLALAPDGSRILAWGYDQRGDDLITDLQASGLYVIDSDRLDVVTHHVSVGPERYYSPFSFSESGVAYATNWSETESTIDVIDIETGDLIATREGEFTQMFGEVGVLGESR